MESKEVGKLLDYVKAGYPNFLRDNDPAIVFDLWSRTLKDYEFDSVMKNLERYMLENEFPPKIKDLVNGIANDTRPRIPGVEETKKIIAGYQVPKEQRIDPLVLQSMIDEMKANIRRSKK